MRKGATREKMAESEVEYVETYYLNRGDKEYQVSMNTPVSAEMISRMFNVERSSVWLRDYITSRVYLPDEEGCFAGFRPTILSRILVEGSDCEGTQSSSMGITLNATRGPGSSRTGACGSGSSGGSGNRSRPGFRSVIPGSGRPCFKEPSYFLKIVKAKMAKPKAKGKITVEVLDQSFLEMTEKEANVAVVSKHIVETWGSNWILVSAEGIEIGDCPATRGEPIDFIAVLIEACMQTNCMIPHIYIQI